MAGAAAAFTGVSLVRRAFGDAALPSGEAVNAAGKAEPVHAAFARARAGRRGVLVLVIPDDKLPSRRKDHNAYQRGLLYGEWLNHGADAQLAPLATVEVVAAKVADLKTEVPSLPGGEPLFFHIDASGLARALDVPVPAYPNWERGDGPSKEPPEDQVSTARIAAVGGLIQRSLPVPASSVKQLAATARAQLVQNRVPGSYWALGSGCGNTIEGDEHPDMVDCGMGHVPAKARRFLYLYTQTPYEQRTKKVPSL